MLEEAIVLLFEATALDETAVAPEDEAGALDERT